MEFRVLGPLELLRDGRSLELRGSKRRAVLALLVLHANEVVRTDRLIEELWGEDRPANAAAALHSHVSRLRKDLGGEVLVTKPWGYVLRADPEAIDLRRFERLVAEARPLPAHERTEKLLDALALWRGPALADLTREPSLQVEIARLDELRLSALEQRIDAELELGGHAELVRELEALVGEHPLRERLRGQLILALYRSGRQAEALETYRETRRVLVEELGIEPSPELRELERAILRQDPSLASTAPPRDPNDTEPAYSRWRWPRSPLVAAALLLLAVGGAGAAAIIVTGEEASPDSAATPPAAAAASRPVSAPSTRQTPRRSSTVGSTSARKAKRATPTTNARPESSAPAVRRVGAREQPARRRPIAQQATTPPKRSVTPKPKPTPPPPPPPPRPPPPAPKLTRISDNFADGVINDGTWYSFTTGTSTAIAERAGRFEVTIGADAVGGGQYNLMSGSVGTQCRFPGDFDARVEYELMRWPAANGVAVELAAFARSGGAQAGRVSSSAAEIYRSWIPPRYGSRVGTSDSRGRLRLRRVDTMLFASYWHVNHWERLDFAPFTGAVAVALQAVTSPNEFGRSDVEVTFDNFVLETPSAVC